MSAVETERDELKAENDRLKRINREHCNAVNALNLDGARLEARLKAAEDERDKLDAIASQLQHDHDMMALANGKLEAERDAALKEQDRLARAWEAKHAAMVKQSKDHEAYYDMTQKRMAELVAERDAAFAAGQEEMRQRAAQIADWREIHAKGETQRACRGIATAIRAMPIKAKPDDRQ